jgi:hypothetical protein
MQKKNAGGLGGGAEMRATGEREWRGVKEGVERGVEVCDKAATS